MSDLIQIHPILSNEPLHDFTYRFKGYHNYESAVQVKIWKLTGGRYFILVFDLNLGTSVTNAAEIIATGLYQNYFAGCDKTKLIFAETYLGTRSRAKTEDIDMWLLTWDEDKVIHVDWRHLAKIEQ